VNWEEDLTGANRICCFGADGPRIASLVPSLTETLVTLGLADRLVARTGYCIHPAPDVARIAKVGGTKTVNLAKLRRLRPSHVVVNVDENRLETIEAIRAWGADAPELVVTHPLGPDDNLSLVERLAATFAAQPGVTERAVALATEIRVELSRTEPSGRAPRRVLYLIWHEPWMTVARDTYLSRMLARVGWQTWPPGDGGATGAGRYPTVSGDEPWLADVELVLLSSEPFAFQAAHREAAQALCPAARVLDVDGELLSWYGARAPAGLRYLRRLAEDNAVPAPT
jgi:ABC-type hemin transport system substrate-binding protein